MRNESKTCAFLYNSGCIDSPLNGQMIKILSITFLQPTHRVKSGCPIRKTSDTPSVRPNRHDCLNKIDIWRIIILLPAPTETICHVIILSRKHLIVVHMYGTLKLRWNQSNCAIFEWEKRGTRQPIYSNFSFVPTSKLFRLRIEEQFQSNPFPPDEVM